MEETNVIEIGTELKHSPLEYIYVTIPADYICVYHRILIMLADYGVDMLKDCKATCTDKNSGVIECFNMFNAAVAARKLGGDKNLKLAETLIKYVKAKINQIYKGKDNSASFVFPVDENGEIKAMVSCGETPMFWISADDGELYEHKFGIGFDEHFRLGEEDGIGEIENVSVENVEASTGIPYESILTVTLIPSYEKIDNKYKPCADIVVIYAGNVINVNKTSYQYYFDDVPVVRFNDVINLTEGIHRFKCVVNYNGVTAIDEKYLKYGG